MQKSSSIPKVLLTVISGLVALVALFPLIWVVIAGFKGKAEVLATPFRFFPKVWLAENYAEILKDPVFTKAMAVTFGGAVLFAALTLFVNASAAYVFARLEFRFKRLLWVYVIMTMFVPAMSILLTSFIVVNKLGMLDTLAVLVLPGVASAGQMFFIRQFYLNIPLALEEAALIDGAGRFRIFTSIFVPMSFPVFVIVGIGAYLGYWNSFVWPTMTITNPDLFQIMQYLYNFRSERGSEMGLLMAGSALAAAPTLILFLIFQRYIIAGIKISGLK
ncbi:carbohydrate ABC transporter permease [Cohnella thailandensis]|uniref:Carbohydrate ABC transporter permease n=1 Tax=Cohnella thailandensis TaxID=557557 RepID=A0A841T229_9BACL|nr:carbohydrate ABC transporter permease [Cohnella thailandensis]MBB6636906.1 carbohydrate ABC transporter permease [Cohnella thailandensis]MBP1973213.1 multiple sugar transport system permease protein [Cohnella thailandensis]